MSNPRHSRGPRCSYCRQPGPEHEECAESYARGHNPRNRDDAVDFLYQRYQARGAQLTERFFPSFPGAVAR